MYNIALENQHVQSKFLQLLLLARLADLNAVILNMTFRMISIRTLDRKLNKLLHPWRIGKKGFSSPSDRLLAFS